MTGPFRAAARCRHAIERVAVSGRVALGTVGLSVYAVSVGRVDDLG